MRIFALCFMLGAFGCGQPGGAQYSAPYAAAPYQQPSPRSDVAALDEYEEDPIDDRLCQSGNQFSCRAIADELATGRTTYSMKRRRVNWPRAIEYYGKACEQGDGESCLILGREYRDGLHVAQDKQRAFELFSKACSDGKDQGCADMRMLSGAVGRLQYSGGQPELAWHCGRYWCYADPITCSRTNSACHTETKAFCAVVSKGGMLYEPCAVDRSSCEAGLKQLEDGGGSKVSECTERAPTVPGQLAGSQWYCSDAFGSAGCTRLLGHCTPGYGRQQCNPQPNAACIIAFDVLNEKYISKCFPSLESCKRETYTFRLKDDYAEQSSCFVAR